jgi:hypothetical protein
MSKWRRVCKAGREATERREGGRDAVRKEQQRRIEIHMELTHEERGGPKAKRDYKTSEWQMSETMRIGAKGHRGSGGTERGA